MSQRHYMGGTSGICWIWTAVDRHEHRFLGFALGSRVDDKAKEIWNVVNNPALGFAMTDHWMVYTRVIPRHLHKATKRQTFTVEGYNSILRQGLARLHRRTKCYSKSLHMLDYSLRLLMAKWNGTLSAII
jgi:insertion element IS1 protein InsB